MTTTFDSRNDYVDLTEPCALADMAGGTKRYVAHKDADGVITLIPSGNLGERELFLLENPQLLAAVNRGIQDIQDGRYSVIEF